MIKQARLDRFIKRERSGRTNEQLLQAFAETGNERYFVKIARRCRPAIRAYLARMVEDEDMAAVLTYETLMVVMRDPARFAQGRKVIAWLHSIATEKGLRAAKARRAYGLVTS